MMVSENSFYSLILLVGAFISLLITIIAWRRRNKTLSARPMAVFGFAMTWWCSTYAIHWSNFYRPSEFFWLDLTYMGVLLVPPSFLVFALCYTKHRHWVTRQTLILLSIEPVVTLFFLWTDARFNFFFAGNRQVGADVILEGGLVYWFNIIYSYILILIAFLLLVQNFWQVPRANRAQTGTILIGAAFPWIVNIITILGLSPFPNLDLTPISFVLTTIAFSYGIFRYGFLDLVPIARDVLVESMSDGVIILDEQDCLVDINPAAMTFLDIDKPAPLGQPIEKSIPTWLDQLPRFIDAKDGQGEILIHRTKPRFFDVRINPLPDRNGQYSGRVISFREITASKESEMELRRATQRLQLQLSEIEALQIKLKEQAIRDPLTGLYNRRYLQDTLERELLRAQRTDQSLSLVLIDIDHFKRCNDTFGHKAGDLVLQALAEMLTEQTRKQDIVYRYGGEEFLIVLPNTLLNVARERTEEWRQTFQGIVVKMDENQINATLSAGIACYPFDGDSVDVLLKVADDALYKAKQGGRNRVVW